MYSKKAIILQKPYFFDEKEPHNNSAIVVSSGKVSKTTIRRGIEIIKEAREIREDARKQEELKNAVVCF